MEEKTMDNVAENEIEKMEDLGQALEESYAHMGNGEYDTDTLLAWEKINEYKEAGTILSVTISGIVNKGVIALVEGVRGFIPVSRLDINHVEDTNDWLGRDIRVRVIEADMEKNKLVLSAREILREESAAARKAQREMAVSKIEVGSVVEGKVESILELLEDISTIPDKVRERIHNEKDIKVLNSWLKLAAKAESIDEFVSKM